MDDNNNKIKINMLSMADSVDGQGVGSAYLELMKLLNEDGKNDFEIFFFINLSSSEKSVLRISLNNSSASL